VTSWSTVIADSGAGLLAQLDPDNPPEGLGRLVLMFLLALVIVAPFAIWTVRRVQAGTWGRRSGRAAADDPAEGHDDQPEEPVEETDEGRLEDLVAAIRSLEGDRSGRALVLVRRHLTSQGRELSEQMADTLIRDALRRSGWRVDAVVPDELGRVLECEPIVDATR